MPKDMRRRFMHTASDVTLIAYVIPAPYIESGIPAPRPEQFSPIDSLQL